MDELQGLQAALSSSNFNGEDGKKASYEGTSFSGDIESEICKLFKLDPESVDRNDLPFKQACREWARATVELWVDHLARLDGQATTNEPSYLRVAKAPPTAAADALQGQLVSEVIEEFLMDRQTGKGLRQTSVDNYRQHIRAFTDVLGDMPVNAVRRGHSIELRDTLLRLPKNRTQPCKSLLHQVSARTA